MYDDARCVPQLKNSPVGGWTCFQSLGQRDTVKNTNSDLLFSIRKKIEMHILPASKQDLAWPDFVIEYFASVSQVQPLVRA
jgi:hypothetical protein